MLSLLLRVLVNALILLGIAYIVPDIAVSSIWSALLFAVALGVVNAFIRPVVRLLSLPITFLSLGLFTLVINALLFWFASSLVFGVEIGSFTAAFLGALLLSLASGLASFFIKK